MNKKLVVHCMIEDYDVYIGRGKCPQTGEYSMWYNPFSHKENTLALYKVSTREESLQKYREYVLGHKGLMKNLHTLKDLTLGCWCKTKKSPQACHGDILVELISEHCF